MMRLFRWKHSDKKNIFYQSFHLFDSLGKVVLSSYKKNSFSLNLSLLFQFMEIDCRKSISF